VRLTGSTRVFAILGDPVAHSLSPAMQNAAFRLMGINAVYVPLRCSAENVPLLMASLAGAGGGGNVTIPHKTAAARAVSRPSSWVRAIDACNTFWSEGGDGPLVGDNTDIEGILAALERMKAPEGPWLLAGTGGSSRAVAAAARERGVALAVTSRDTARGLAWLSAIVDHRVASRLAPQLLRTNVERRDYAIDTGYGGIPLVYVPPPEAHIGGGVELAAPPDALIGAAVAAGPCSHEGFPNIDVGKDGIG